MPVLDNDYDDDNDDDNNDDNDNDNDNDSDDDADADDDDDEESQGQPVNVPPDRFDDVRAHIEEINETFDVTIVVPPPGGRAIRYAHRTSNIPCGYRYGYCVL
jgi:hypothetical protein